jgi:hypothetical protein
MGSWPAWATHRSPISRSQPAIQSKTSFETFVLLQTTMKTGGVRPFAWASAFFFQSR